LRLKPKGIRKKKSFSLTFKISMTITLLITIVMMGMGSLTYVMNHRALLQQETGQGHSIGAVAKEMIRPSMAEQDTQAMHRMILLMKEDAKIDQAYVTNADGEIWVHEQEANLGNRMQSRALDSAMASGAVEVQQILTESGGLPGLLFVVPVTNTVGQTMGYLHFITDFSPVQIFLYETAMQWIKIFVGVVLMSLILVRMIIVKAVGKPVKNLLSITEKAAVGNFSEELEPGTQDELGQLAEGFNLMNRQLGILFRSIYQTVSEMDYSSQLIVTRSETMAASEDTWAPEKQQEWIREINASGKRLVRVSDKLQSFLNQFQIKEQP
jgi:methyl-accepting chemotaxis protein